MSSTELRTAEQLAAALFDDVVAPLAAARSARGAPAYVSIGRDGQAKSYFFSVAQSPTPADFTLPGGGAAAGLIQATVAHWAASDDADLCALGPGLQRIAAAVEAEAAEDDGSVSVFCYAMF